MPSSNARSSTTSSPKTSPTDFGELVYLISRLVTDRAGYAANHIEVRGRCTTCREVWPCSGGSLADKVIGMPERRGG